MTCPLCDETVQMPRLAECGSVYAMPDKYPLRPGHVLIATRAHESCYAALPEERAEMLELAAGLRRFVREMYGEDSVLVENGPGNQTVPHAHAHVIPVRPGTPSLPLGELHELDPTDPWPAVEDAWRRGERYRYVAWDGAHRLQLGGNLANPSVLHWISDALEIRRGLDGRPLRPHRPEQIEETVTRWRGWSSA